MQLCRRKRVVLLLGLIILVSVLSTYWIETWLQHDPDFLHDGSYSRETKNAQEKVKLNEVLRGKGTSIRENRFTRTDSDSAVLLTPPQKLRYSITTEEMVTNKIRETGLLQRLEESEEKMTQGQLDVLLANHSQSNAKDLLEPFKHALESLGYRVVLLKDAEILPYMEKRWQGINWCFGKKKSACFKSSDLVLLQKNQRVSLVPGFEKLLLRNDGFCYLMSTLKFVSAFENRPLSPPCIVLPAQINVSLVQDINTKKSQYFTLKSLGTISTSPHNWGAMKSLSDKKRIEYSEGVMQLFPADVLLIEDKAVIAQMYVLDGSGSNWKFEMFYRYLVENFGEDKTSKTIEEMDELVVKMFLLLEQSLITHFTGLNAEGGQKKFRCQSCFQVLEISFTFSSSLTSYILEAKAPSYENISQKIVEDIINLLFNMTSIPFSHDVYKTVKAWKENVTIKKRECQLEMENCLTDDLLAYLSQFEVEKQHRGDFKQLYPTSDGDKYKTLMLELLDTGVELDPKKRADLGTPDVHDFLTAFEAARSTHPLGHRSGSGSESHVSTGSSKETVCVNDPNVESILTELISQPEIVLHPPFNSDVFSYQTTVSFDTTILQLWGKASKCHLDVRIDTKSEESRKSNHSLGVGWNKFSIFVVDTRQKRAEVVNTYHLFVFRKRRSETESIFEEDSTHRVCAIYQECSLKVFPDLPCGLKKLPDSTWKTFLSKQKELPHCETGHELGRWVLPCASCDDPASCFWRQTVWSPLTCQYSVFSKNHTRNCLANRKILFVGDSTNRGIMYYLMEKLNGSLRKWEKTHTMKIYSDELNSGRTSVSFAYYPQFWLRENKRPVFVKALYQLIARFLPLENNTKTILVVGGVQWMGFQHILETNKALASLGLNGIKVVIKSLGSGFHLPVPGLPRHNLAEQRKTAERNQMVIKAAKRLGYEVVDTFGMTVSRYKDFLQGNCGCHFHKVVDMRSLIKEEDEVPSPLLENTQKETDFLPRYHVMGPINSIYSELVISRMCS
ncbi:Cadherin-like and PC-esterase domain-containing protein 1 [Stylophora pistillata]|uniref:Cadherin-like and PC-esterase domain-containing protein 1 n=1 Tax=Stylophora pistillata TaxID=50429 RepID=A0A2B4RZD9_STYPI|nr:Cadherin-like and PC-esterase domain-containing protein 1 [Stylophora pistillata]